VFKLLARRVSLIPYIAYRAGRSRSRTSLRYATYCMPRFPGVIPDTFWLRQTLARCYFAAVSTTGIGLENNHSGSHLTRWLSYACIWLMIPSIKRRVGKEKRRVGKEERKVRKESMFLSSLSMGYISAHAGGIDNVVRGIRDLPNL